MHPLYDHMQCGLYLRVTAEYISFNCLIIVNEQESGCIISEHFNIVEHLSSHSYNLPSFPICLFYLVTEVLKMRLTLCFQW